MGLFEKNMLTLQRLLGTHMHTSYRAGKICTGIHILMYIDNDETQFRGDFEIIYVDAWLSNLTFVSKSFLDSSLDTSTT
jgi:hypothetical protein